MKGYFNSSINSIDGGGPPKLNHLMDIVSPINSPLGDSNSIPMRYLPSGLLADHDQSPNNSRSIVNYHYYNSRSSSRSPLSSVENLEVSPALVKVEDNVLVMDGIFVSSATPKSSGKYRSPAASDSGSGSLYKKELCLSWEDAGSCRYGHKCQFAHGQEELRPVPFHAHNTNKSKSITSQPYFSPPASRFSPGNRIVFGNYKSEQPIKIGTPQSSKALPMQLKDTSTTVTQSNKLPMQLKNPSTPAPEANSTDWCPLDDGIVATLPSRDKPASRHAVNAHICNILYGCNQKKRLPVFSDICTE